MIRDWFKKSKIEDTHPSDESLLKHVDGELSSKEGAYVRSHLETCWSCRRSLEKIEETISTFVEFRQQIQIPLTQEPPSNWSDFDRRLNGLATLTPAVAGSWWSRTGNGFGKFFHSFALFSLWSSGRKQTAIGALAAGLIAVLVWQLVIVRPISASELLDRSLQFQTDQISEVPQAVVYQKLHVSRNGVSEINWEVWRDTTRARFRQSVTNSVNAAFDQELSNVLQLNGFDPQQPMSPSTFINWRKGLIGKTDTVEQAKADDGSGLIVLHTTNTAANAPGEIAEASVTLRSNDFHPVGQVLRVRSGDGVQTYEFTEVDFRVLSLTAFAPDFFREPAQPQIASVAASAVPKPEEANANVLTANSNVAEKPAAVPFRPASADLEIEVFSLLNKAKADLGEQITVSREADGRLSVQGLVDTANRKNEILDALTSVRNDPAVRIEIKTIGEAVAEQKSTPKPAGTAETVESQSSATAADSELLSYFRSEDAARRFGGQMIARSNRAMSRAYSLKRLVGQFTPDELRKLSPDSRSKLLALVRTYAGTIREECEGLQSELRPVFGSVNAGAAGTPDVGDVTSLPGAVDALVTLASTNDTVVRSAFTLSAKGPGFTAIKTSQFWQSLKTAEALAMKLQSVK